MSIHEYEQSGGFRRELTVLHGIGASLVRMEDLIAARPYREDELRGVRSIKAAIDHLRNEISKTRDLGS